MIDTHCHIFLDAFDEDRTEVLNRAAEAGVEEIFMPAIDFDSLDLMEKMEHEEIAFHKMAGIHPTQIDHLQTDLEEQLLQYCSQDEIAAVGETGLDFYWSTDFRDQQIASLHTHCKVAKQVDKPIVLHNRNSTDELLDLIEEEQDGTLRGIWHCFNGSLEEGLRAIDIGLHLGIGGLLTFGNADVDKSVSQLPLARMVLETDAPYLAPEPKRGKRNEPGFIRYTAKKLGALMDLPLSEVIEKTSATARTIFRQ